MKNKSWIFEIKAIYVKFVNKCCVHGLLVKAKLADNQI